MPGNSNFGTSAFCVMRWEAKAWDSRTDSLLNSGCSFGLGSCEDNWANESVVPVSVSQEIPWRFITFGSDSAYAAIDACESQGWSLVTNRQWMTIARDIEGQNENWVDGIIGSSRSSGGGMILGLSSGSPSNSDGLNEGSGTDRRTFKLSTGDVIWDVSGNMWEYVDLTETGDAFTSYVCDNAGQWNEFRDCNFVAPFSANDSVDKRFELGPSNADYDTSNHVGQVHTRDESYDDTILRRGGSLYDSSSYTGIYTSTRVEIDHQAANVGFRCVASPIHYS